jgi:hypothetical protein
MARQARKNTNLVENVKEINQWYYTCKIGVRVQKTRFMTVACAKLICILKIVLRAMFVSTGTI